MPSIGSMRSDAISSKTIIVAESPRKKQAKVVAIDKIRSFLYSAQLPMYIFENKHTTL